MIRYDVPLIEFDMNRYDTLHDDSFDLDRDGLLKRRSACELVREQPSPSQRAELDMIDAHWRSHLAAFDYAFGVMHQFSRKTDLAGDMTGAGGNTPAIPRSQWWWPIGGAKE
ncbi:MAG: hypothetical protein Q4G25_01305 [Paracoccus sp. (in: a-proteobacteria)]|nr:hypothetical protein [Paracoccus sp. (in: a-proteobacteria)]